MAGPTGINGITGYVISSPEAPPFQQQGGTVDPKHGIAGEDASPYPWENVPMGPYPGLINPVSGIIEDPSQYGLPSGMLGQDPTGDQTPSDYNAAPFSRENPLAPMADQVDVHNRRAGSTRQLLDSMRVHASNTGAGLKRLFLPQMLSKQDQWTAFYNPVPGEDNVPTVPGAIGMVAGGYNVNDHRNNPYAKVNEYGLATSHRHRRYATGPIPGNTLWLKARSRPMIRTLTNQYNFPTSGAFAGDDPGASFSTAGAVLTATPTEYVPPPQPNLGPPITVTPDNGVPEISYY